jgi:hypothetical protein
MKRSILVLGLLGILLASAFGQGNLLEAKIPFEFVAGSKTLPAGNYDFGASGNLIRMNDHDTGKTVALLESLTRIAADMTATGTARISFDVQEGRYFIEAIWPEHGDGYLIHTVKGEHTHEVVRLK